MKSDDADPSKPAFVPTDAVQASVAEQQDGHSCPVVGIGASAGGLIQAFTLFLSHLPEDGMAFVLIQPN